MTPFFSVIIPCYNSDTNKIMRILNSISNQKMNDEIEVIIVDDCSTDKSYFKALYQYRFILNIKLIETDYNFGPGNTREKGVSVATGQWITFIDHDDVFVPDVFGYVQEYINLNRIYNVVSTDVNLVSESGEVLSNLSVQYCILHGKFFNRDFWNRYHIHFKKDLFGSEDVYVFTLLNYVAMTFGEKYHNYHKLTYKWIDDFTSVSRKHNKGYNTYAEKTYNDNITATFRTWVELKNKSKFPLDESNAFTQCLKALIISYIMLKGFMHSYKLKFKKKNLVYFFRMYKDFCNEFNIDSNFIIRKLINDKWKIFYDCGDELSELCGYLKNANPRNFCKWLKVMDILRRL